MIRVFIRRFRAERLDPYNGLALTPTFDLLVNRGLNGYKWIHIPAIAIVAFITTCIWFGLEVINNGWWMVNEFITYQVRLFSTEDAGHGGPFRDSTGREVKKLK